MNESGVWQYLRKNLSAHAHLTRIESSAGNGVPDVSIGIPGKNVWMELKYVREWPKRITTKVKLPLRNEQKLWIKVRGHLSGDVWVLIRIENSFFLLDWEQVIEACNGWVLFEWIDKSTKNWDGKIDFDELISTLNNGG